MTHHSRARRSLRVRRRLAALPRRAALRAADLALIRAGTIPADVSAVITYADDLGYFKDAGLDVQISLMQSGPVIAPAVIGGTLDVGAANIASIAAARERGLPLKFFAPASIATPTTLTDPVMVMKRLADQDGRRSQRQDRRDRRDENDAACGVLLWADKHGADSKSIKLIEIPFPEMVAALDTGRVDAAIPSEPFTSQGLAANRLLGSVYASMPATILVFGFFATDTWLNAHADQAVKFAGSDSQSRRVGERASERIGGDAHHIHQSRSASRGDSMGRAVYATSLEPAQIQPVLDNAVRYGMLDQTARRERDLEAGNRMTARANREHQLRFAREVRHDAAVVEHDRRTADRRDAAAGRLAAHDALAPAQRTRGARHARETRRGDATPGRRARRPADLPLHGGEHAFAGNPRARSPSASKRSRRFRSRLRRRRSSPRCKRCRPARSC